nr:hypothetical protein [uncultured Carboxylicivirga sp.]
MASGITTIVKLEPFLQQFLIMHFGQDPEQPFIFPKGHDLNTRLNLLLSNPPFNFVGHNYGDESFELELYYNNENDVRQRNYISPTMAKVFAQKVRDFYTMLFHEFYAKRYRLLGHKNTVYQWMELYDMNESFYDRIERDARRYRRKNSNKKYYEKRKLINVKSSQVNSDFCPV